MPICPYCKQEIITLYSSQKRELVWQDGKWVVDMSGDEVSIACSACYEELGLRDLDKLSVPNELR
jgi:hypothetical protein